MCKHLPGFPQSAGMTSKRDTRPLTIPVVIVLATVLTGCSARKFAVNKLGDSLANGGATYVSDNDPEFIGQRFRSVSNSLKGCLPKAPTTAVFCLPQPVDTRSIRTFTFNCPRKR